MTSAPVFALSFSVTGYTAADGHPALAALVLLSALPLATVLVRGRKGGSVEPVKGTGE